MKYFTGCLVALIIISIIPPAVFGQDNVGFPNNIMDSTAKVTPFAPGVVSTRYDEGATSFSPDGKTVYFTMGSVYSTICFSKNVDGKWTRPQVASFSGRWNDMDAFVSPDGKKLFFASTRPVPGSADGKPNNHAELWYAENTGGDNWGAPRLLDTAVNTGNYNTYAPSVSSDGTLYWCCPNRDGSKGMQGYYAVWHGDHYEPSKLLSITGVTHIQDPFIAPNGKYLVFLNGQALFVSMWLQGAWSPAVKFGPPVSMGDYVGSPYVSRDGKTLYFTTSRIHGFYKRDPLNHALDFDELIKENDSLFNGGGNILQVPVNLPDGN